MEQVTTIGLDIVKHVFQAHGADVAGHVLIPQARHTPEASWVLGGASALYHRHGSLCRRALLGPRGWQVGP
jgi:hypothetical protein